MSNKLDFWCLLILAPFPGKLESSSKFIGPAGVNYVILFCIPVQTMKKALIFAVFMAVLTFVQAQSNTSIVSEPVKAVSPTPGADILKLKEKVHYFGKIAQGRPVTYTFEIVNTGSEPLKLANVQASCGCTTPEWSRDAIEPGGSSFIKVGYNAYAEGAFNKTVTIFYGNNLTKVLTITGDVYKSPATSAPQNPSVQFLKQTN
jgi:hypothetical protein